MKTLVVALALVALTGCAKHLQYQDPSSEGGGGGGEESEGSGGESVGEPSKPTASGFLDMPFLTGLSEEQARDTLARSQMTGEIKIERVECFDKKIPSGHVCNSHPAGGSPTSTTSPTTLFVVQ